MITILWDHVRRWWWLWLLSCAACAYLVGGGRPLAPDLSNAWFPLAMYLGVVQLSVDLQRGDVTRVLRAMPVTARQVGRAWWWASVGFPGVVMAVITGCVFAFVSAFGSRPISLVACFNFWLTNALLFGPPFYSLTGIPPMGSAQSGRPTGRGCLFGLLFVGSTFTMLYFYRLFPPPTMRWKVFVAVAALLTVAGWFRAEAFAREHLGADSWRRASFANANRVLRGMGADPLRGAEGDGGLPLLFRTIFNHMVLMGLFMVMLMGGALIAGQWFTSAFTDNKLAVDTTTICVTAQVLFWLICWQTTKAALHLRFLRTLPVSTTRLAGVLILAPVTSMLVVFGFASLMFALFFPALRVSPLTLLRGGCLPEIALATFVVPLVVRRGMDLLSFAIVMVVLVGGSISALLLKEQLSLLVSGAFSTLFVLGCFLLTRLFLERSSATYRPRKNQFADMQWGTGR